jgi:hypothetical protein
MLSWVSTRGLVVMSLPVGTRNDRRYLNHSASSLQRQGSGHFRYIDDAGWERIKAGYETAGYGYSDYEGQKGYGISLTIPSWMASLVERLPSARMITFSERAWDDHHDVIAIQSI